MSSPIGTHASVSSLLFHLTLAKVLPLLVECSRICFIFVSPSCALNSVVFVLLLVVVLLCVGLLVGLGLWLVCGLLVVWWYDNEVAKLEVGGGVGGGVVGGVVGGLMSIIPVYGTIANCSV